MNGAMFSVSSAVNTVVAGHVMHCALTISATLATNRLTMIFGGSTGEVQ